MTSSVIIIPKEVWSELITEGKGKPGTNEIEKVKWIKVEEVKNNSLVKTLTKDLDVGESAAIALTFCKGLKVLYYIDSPTVAIKQAPSTSTPLSLLPRSALLPSKVLTSFEKPLSLHGSSSS